MLWGSVPGRVWRASVRLEKLLVKVLRSGAGPLSPTEIETALADRNERVSQDRLQATLAAMERLGTVVRAADGRWSALRERGLAVGRLSVNRRGYGFVLTAAGDVYVAGRDMLGALHGDIVAVRVDTKTRSRGRSGVVAQVVERANDTIVGRFERHGKVGLVVPTDRRIRADVIVDRTPAPLAVHARELSGEPLSTRPAARAPEHGDVVVVRLTRYPSRDSSAQGVVTEILGRETDPGIHIETIIREHGLRDSFPADVEAAAEGLRLDVDAALADPDREDLRNLFTVTIDPVDARDFDDAITLERREGGFRLGVHIADVSHYVPWGDAVDEEARRRATSVYLVDRVLPMLPERLSNDICSLRPGEDRLCMSVHIDLDRDGVVEGYRLSPSVIRSDRRLDYDSVDAWLASGEGFPDPQTRSLLDDLARVAAAVGRRRVARGGLDFETVEAKVLLAVDGTPIDVRLRERTVATNMIEESMVLANEVVAGHMVGAGAPMMFRIHEDPEQDALAQVAAVLREFDYPIKDVGGARPETFQKIIKFAHGRPEQLLINSLLLRALEQARYSHELVGHFGLASQTYCHFTSPIRRYPDLIVHRLLKAQLAGALPEERGVASSDAEGYSATGEGVSEMVEELEWLAEHCSVMEREAEQAEDESVKVKLCELMLGHLGDVFDGIITGVAPFGMFVQLPNTAEGLVHVTTLADDYYRLDAERFLMFGERQGRVHRLGDRVRVRVVEVSVGDRRIDLELAEGADAGASIGHRV